MESEEIKQQLEAVEDLLKEQPGDEEALAIKAQLEEMLALCDDITELRGPEVSMFDGDMDALGDLLFMKKEVAAPDPKDLIEKIEFVSGSSLEESLNNSVKRSTFDGNGRSKNPESFGSANGSSSYSSDREGYHTIFSDGIAEWETYTKGFGSKILKKFGYIHGTGLGVDKTGISQPLFVDSRGSSTNRGLGHEDRGGGTTEKRVVKKRKRVLYNSGSSNNFSESTTLFDGLNATVNKSYKKKKITKTNMHGMAKKQLEMHLKNLNEKLGSIQRLISKQELSYTRNLSRDPVIARQVQAKQTQTKAQLNSIMEEIKEVKSRLDLKDHSVGRKKLKHLF